MTDLRAGWAVLGNDGGRIGTIKHVGQDYVLTSRRRFDPGLFIPVSFIANVEHETVHLSIPQQAADQMGWEQGPRADDELEADPDSDLHRHF